MILELDCGNSFIKWRVISVDGAQRLLAGVVDSDAALFESLAAAPELRVSRCRLVSVRSDAETELLVARLRESLGVDAVCAQCASRVGAVHNGYEDFRRLGLDRWLAVLGAYHLGLPLMRDQLSTHTRRIRYDRQVALAALHELEPGRSTAEAVERGCVLMLRGFVVEQLLQAQARFPEGFEVFLTGGDAGLVRDVVPGAQVVPDLVFVGLAIACPLS